MSKKKVGRPSSGQDLRVVTVKLPDELVSRLDRHAKQFLQTRSVVLRRMIENGLDDERDGPRRR
jgi:metal-responsive CopG/Arc/MetJ family transcriptional regulator